MLKHFFTAIAMAATLFTTGAMAQLPAADIDAYGLMGDTCGITSGLFSKTRVAESDKTLNLSTAFLSGTKATFSYTTAWSGRMSCTYGNVGIGGLLQDHLYYFTALGGNPVYLNFTSADGESDYWVKVTAEITGDTKVTVNGIIGTHSISYQTSYTITAELLSTAPSGVESYTKTTTSGVASIIPAVMSGAGASDSTFGGLWGNKYTYAEEVFDNMMNDLDRSSWSTSRYIAFERLYIQFDPNQTTCNLKKDMTVQLPPTSVSILQRDGKAPGTNFVVPITCVNMLGGSKSTRNIRAWISSNDILNDASTGTILVNDETDAGGVGISLRPYNLGIAEDDLVISSGMTDLGATEIFTIDEGEAVDGDFALYMNAYYKVYNASALTSGKVVATAQIMFGYD